MAIKKEELFKYIEEKKIELSDEKRKLLESKDELTDEDLKEVSGGWFWELPNNPTCPKCGSTDTYSRWAPWPEGVCRDCDHKWHL